MSILVVAEKNNAAKRISSILSKKTVGKKYYYKVPVYTFDRDGKTFFVIGLAGHIIRLDYPDKYNRWGDIDPEKLIHVDPIKKTSSGYSYGIVRALQEIARDVSEVVIATDFDREGELIGVEAIEIIKKIKPNLPVKRAKFSALTGYEIETAFNNLTPVDYNLASSAETRQYIDLAWGASLTRFLSISSGKYGKDFLSAGRVQSPALALIVKREIEIDAFEPIPYWEVRAAFKEGFTAEHEHGRFLKKEDAKQILERVANEKEGKVKDYSEKEVKDRPPVPFNTTLFLADAAAQGMSSFRAMQVAEELYTSGWISYPRTDNTVYPRSLNLRSVVNSLLDSDLKDLAGEILALGKLVPTRGRVETTDHPPIYPVRGATKKQLKGEKWTIYELVVRRFLATLAPSAIILENEAKIEIKREMFIAKGKTLLKEGWRRYYPYYKMRGEPLPNLEVGRSLDIDRISMIEKATKPPPRYSESSLIKVMEKLGLGTKSTRHEIIKKLYDRSYVEKGLRPTESGIAVAKTLIEHAPEFSEPKMTQTLESDMDKIAEGKIGMDAVVQESREMLGRVLTQLRKNEGEIGASIKNAINTQEIIGKCPKCDSPIAVKRSRKGKRFAACTNYPNCRVTYPLPPRGKIVPTSWKCNQCQAPIVKILTKGKKPWRMCLNIDCKSKNSG